MDIIKSFRRNVVENNKLVFVAILITCLIRFGFYCIYDPFIIDNHCEGSVFSSFFSLYLGNNILSFLLSLLFLSATVLYSVYLNSKHKLIRDRTYLIYLFPILLFSSHPIFIYMNPQYVVLFLILICFDSLLSSYQKPKASSNAYTIGFLLGLSTLFSYHAIVYFLIFLVGLKYMRCLNLRTFLALLFGLFTIYWIVLSYFLWQGFTDDFSKCVDSFYPILNYDIYRLTSSKLIILGSCTVLLMILVFNYWSTSFHDKIQTRANLSFLFLIAIFSFLSIIFINYDHVLNLYIFIITSCFLLSHFFSLADRKWIVCLFYVFIGVYILMVVYLLINKVISPISAS